MSKQSKSQLGLRTDGLLWLSCDFVVYAASEARLGHWSQLSRTTSPCSEEFRGGCSQASTDTLLQHEADRDLVLGVISSRPASQARAQLPNTPI